MNKKINYLYKKNDGIYVTSPMIKVYILSDYFDKNMASKEGTMLRTYGIFRFSVHRSDSEDSTPEFHDFKYPESILMQFETDEKKIMDIGKGMKEYRVITLLEGMKFMNTAIHIQKVSGIDGFLQHMNYSRVSNVPYDDMLTLMNRASKMNGVNLGVPSMILEGIVSELCRNPNNFSESFRKIAGDIGVGMDDYKMVGLDNLAHFNSTFTSIAFENLNKGILLSAKRERYNDPQQKSPIEKTIYY